MDSLTVILSTLALIVLANGAPLPEAEVHLKDSETVDIPASQETVCSLYSYATQQFVHFLPDGSVTADGHFPTLEADLHIHYLTASSEDSNQQVRIQSAKELTYLVYDNETFEMISFGDETYSFLLVITPQQGSGDAASGAGSGEPEVVSNCYLGFSAETREPACYNTTDIPETRYRIAKFV